MDFDEFQDDANRSDSIPCTGEDKLRFLIFGLQDEAGGLAGLAKKSTEKGHNRWRFEKGCNRTPW